LIEPSSWRILALFTVVTAAGLLAMTLWLRPGSLFSFPRYSPELWSRVMMFYPLLSVIPQGIIYRALFFERYGRLIPNDHLAIVMSAAAFSLGHLFFGNWVALSLTFAGGLVFAWAYRVKGSFWFANLLHAIGGWTVFTVGLGRFFYHGAV